MIRYINIFSFLLILFVSGNAFAGKISGRITDEKGEPIPFANVYISGTSTGTTANLEGYYTLELKAGAYELSFRMVGFTLEKRQVSVTEKDQVLDIRMQTEMMNLREVTVRADAEDPAYAIIRKAQKKRKFYRENVQAFSCKAYVKSTQRLTSYPEMFMGSDVDLGGLIDTVSKIFYLSESVSELFYKYPDDYKEKMLSSKVSGSPQAYSFNQAPDVLINLHENLVKIGNLVPRGIVSPISADAMFFYKYRFERSYVENGQTINQISVIPKRINDPVFTGTVYITDDSWRLYSADLFITKNQQMEFLDTFNIRQNFIPLGNDIWLPFSHQMTYSFNIFGFKGDGIITGVFSNYDLSEKSADFNRGEIFKIEKEANKKDSLYWNEVRPMPLTAEEQKDYHRKDSVRVIKESKPYLDSVDAVNNKFRFNAIFSGYTFNDSYNKRSFRVSSPAQEVFYNTVEGWNTRMNLTYKREFGQYDLRRWSIRQHFRYGLSNRRFNSDLKFEYVYDPHKLAVFSVNAGTAVSQINDRNPISDMTNSLYALWGEKNYMKLYEKQFININHRSELANGIGFGIDVEYANRLPLVNTSNYRFKDIPDRVFESNNPFNTQVDTPAFVRHQALITEAVLAIKPGMKYANRPEGKFNLGTKFPILRLYYTKGWNGLGSDIDFDMYRVSLSDEMQLGLLGSLSYQVSYGDFINTRRMFIQDFRHFNGNRTFFSQFRLDDFRSLEYYRYSTISSFVEGHAEYNMGGFILNKIPLLRKLKLTEVFTVHVLDTKDINRFVELTAGIEKLNLLRLEVVTSIAEGRRGAFGFVFGIKRTFGL